MPDVIYKKAYTRENSLLCYQLWEEHQTRRIQGVLEWVAEPGIFDVSEGVADVYYRQGTFDQFQAQIASMIEKDSAFVEKTMHRYNDLLMYLEARWHTKRPLESTAELFTFYDKAVDAWCCLDVSYEVPKMERLSQAERDLAMSFRTRSADFLEENDHVFQRTLETLHPELGALVKYLRIEEVLGHDPLPTRAILEERCNHYIYYKYEVLTGVSFAEFLRSQHLSVPIEATENSEIVMGQTAMTGKVMGRVRILRRKAEIPTLEEGEVLVTAMTTPDYLPAMHKAVAFVTDEGGITCHAAIVARELKKPCVIGTKVATQVLRDGDLVEVDAEKGIVKILNKSNG